MTTLAAGTSTTISLAVGQSLFFSPGGSGLAVLSGGQKAGEQYKIGPSPVEIGPFSQVQAVSVSAVAPVGYFILPIDAANDLPAWPVTVDAAGNVSDPRIQAAVSGGGNSTSMMWIGDSLTHSGNGGYHPLVDYGTPTFRYSYTLPNVSPGGNFVRYFNNEYSTPTGIGTLRYFAASQEFTWQAFGQEAGPRTSSRDAVFLKVESGSPGAAIYLALTQSGRPIVDAEDSTINILGNFTHKLTARASFGGHTGAASILMNHVFEPEYNFGVSGVTAVEMLAGSAAWANVKTDITCIHLGTNGVIDLATAEQQLAAVESIIKLRQESGSKVVVGGQFPRDGATGAGLGARHHYDLLLQQLCKKLGVTYWSAWNQLATAVLADGSFRIDKGANFYNADGTHLNSVGSFVAAKTGLVPAIKDIVPDATEACMAGVAYSATAPYGNLLTNGLLRGTAGTKGNARVTGDVPDSWTVTTSAGTAMTVACTAPSSGSPIARPNNVAGHWFRMAINNGTGVAGETMTLSQTAVVSPANLAEGDYYVCEGDYQFSATAPGATSLAIISMSAEAISTYSGRPLNTLDEQTLTGRFRSKPTRVVPGFSNMNLTTTVVMQAGATAVLDLGPVSIHKVPAPVLE